MQGLSYDGDASWWPDSFREEEAAILYRTGEFMHASLVALLGGGADTEHAVSGARSRPEGMATTDAVFSAARCSGVGTATRKGGEMTRIGARQQGRGAGGVGPRPLVLGARPGSSGRKANCRRGDQVDLLASGLCSSRDIF